MMMLSIDGSRSGLRFSATHMIPKHHKCSRIHGHTYIISTKIHGDVDEDSLVMDFGVIKKCLKAIAEELDHSLMVATMNKYTNIIDLDTLEAVSTHTDETSVAKNPFPGYLEIIICEKHYIVPKEDVRLLDIPATTAEELSKYVLNRLLEGSEFPENVTEVEIGIEEGWGQGAWAKEQL